MHALTWPMSETYCWQSRIASGSQAARCCGVHCCAMAGQDANVSVRPRSAAPAMIGRSFGWAVRTSIIHPPSGSCPGIYCQFNGQGKQRRHFRDGNPPREFSVHCPGTKWSAKSCNSMKAAGSRCPCLDSVQKGVRHVEVVYGRYCACNRDATCFGADHGPFGRRPSHRAERAKLRCRDSR
jgi:hypothetical protein